MEFSPKNHHIFFVIILLDCAEMLLLLLGRRGSVFWAHNLLEVEGLCEVLVKLI